MGKQPFHFDWITAIILLLLSSFGLFLLLTIGQSLFFQQFAYVFAGAVLLVICSRLDPLLLKWVGPVCYGAANVFLALTYLGPRIRGATRWITIAGIQLQPSELVKPLLLLSFAFFMTKFSPRSMKHLPIHAALFVIPFILVFGQPDLGSSIVYGGFWFAMLVAGGLPIGFVILSVLMGIMVFPFAWPLLASYQKSRILTFLNPELDPKGAGYNALQSMIAVGSGKLFGRGLGRGTQSHLRFLPEHHTDFIFATLIEELGFIGGGLLLLGYMMLLVRILRPLFHEFVDDAFVFLYSIGLFAMLLAQIGINMGMNMGLIPITGITLPFVSYGGSSILASSISFGILWALKREKRSDGIVAITPSS